MFPNFLTEYNALKANFYLAQSYYADDLATNSIPHYEYIISKSRNEFTEQALSRLADIYTKKSDIAKANIVLKRLETEADFPQNITFAQSNLMKNYYELKEYPNAVIYADKVLANPKIDDKVKSGCANYCGAFCNKSQTMKPKLERLMPNCKPLPKANLLPKPCFMMLISKIKMPSSKLLIKWFRN